MNSIKYLTWGLALCAGMAITGCKSDYMDQVPSESVSDATINSSVDNLMIALNGLHREMVSQESGYQCFGGLAGFMFTRDWQADDIVAHSSSSWYTRLAQWPYNTDKKSGYNYTYWKIYYQWILNANKILEGLESIDAASLTESGKATYNQVKGEALCVRAFAHYDMVQQYANRYVPGDANTQPGVPYRTDSKGGELARSTVADTYKQINADLDQACTLLAGIKPNDTNHYSDMSAWGLKARVALTMGDYSNAAQYAEKAIQAAETTHGRALMTGDQLYNGFADITTKSKEAMYSAMTPDDQTVYFYSFMAYMSWNFNSSAVRSYVNCINKELYETMSATDLRLAWWDPTGTAAVPASNFAKQPYQNRKFTARSSSNAVCDVAFMRLSEMYLIAAEANARAGQTAAAQTVFQKFQVTRDPAYLACTSTGEALINEIMNSRRVELWGEGQRFFDLKRLHMDCVRGSNAKLSEAGFLTKGADEKGWTYEIPQNEVDYNPLCTYNY